MDPSPGDPFPSVDLGHCWQIEGEKWYTSMLAVKAALAGTYEPFIFPNIYTLDTGRFFYWQRISVDSMILLLEDRGNNRPKTPGLLEICRVIHLPHEWTGVGNFLILDAWDETNDLQYLLAFYHYSTDPHQLERLRMEPKELNGTPFIFLLLGTDHSQKFRELFEEGFDLHL